MFFSKNKKSPTHANTDHGHPPISLYECLLREGRVGEPPFEKGSTNKHETCSKGTQGVLKMCPLREFQEKEKRCGSVPKVALSTQKITLIQSVPGA